MSKYIEELSPGECFVEEENKYILTTDFRKDGKRFCINMVDGSARWLAADKVVEKISIYMLDDNSNFMPVKQEPSDVNLIKNQHIS